MGTYTAGKKWGSVFIGGKRIGSMYKDGKCIYSAGYGLITNNAYATLSIPAPDPVPVKSEIVFDIRTSDESNVIFANGGNVGCYYVYRSPSGNLKFRLPGIPNNLTPETIPMAINTRQTVRLVFDNAIQTCYAWVDDQQWEGNYPDMFNQTGVISIPHNNISSRASYTFYNIRLYSDDVLYCDLWPVPQGSTTYSSTPATSNCMWDKVTQQYFINTGSGDFGIANG